MKLAMRARTGWVLAAAISISAVPSQVTLGASPAPAAPLQIPVEYHKLRTA